MRTSMCQGHLAERLSRQVPGVHPVKVSANSASFYAKTTGTTGTTRTGIANTNYAWVDLGEIVANNSTLEIHAWMSGGAGTVSVDSVEAILTEDQTRTSPHYYGST